MKNNFYRAGGVAVALALGILPAAAFAQSQSMSSGDDDASIQATSLVQEEGTSMSVSARAEDESTQEQKQQGVSQKSQTQRFEVSDANEESSVDEDQDIDEEDDFSFDLEDDEDRAFSSDDLKQRIEIRKQKLDDEEASTTPELRDVMSGANGMRLAVHALLSAQDLIGGIGQQVSEIAKEVDRSVASTTSAEIKIQSRGFFTRFLFGGDSTSAEVIAQEAAQNQSRIDSLTALLAQANISADVQVTLKAQITALQTAQARLQAFAEKEKAAWGLFSWRF